VLFERIVANILIADPVSIFRAALSALLGARHRVLGIEGSIVELALRARDIDTGIIILEPELPGDVEGALRTIRADRPGVRVLLLTASTDRELIGGSLSAGASGYVSKHDPPEHLFEALERLAAGETYVSDALAPIFDTSEGDVLVPVNTADWDLESEPSVIDADGTRLTEREREILVLVANGERLHISAQTVRKHRENLRRKLGAHNTAQVTAYAIRAGLIGEC
jgi:DNA-binding NarL/FixJ family response regulator